MPRASTTSPLQQPEFSDELSGFIARGNTQMVRAYFDSVFWEKKSERPDWNHLKLALLRDDLSMTRLLVTWGARATEEGLAELQKMDPKKYPQHLKMLRQAGHGISPQKLAESTKTAEAAKDHNESLDELLIRSFVDDKFVDHRIAKLPAEWRHTLGAFHRTGAKEAVIGGGALRDLFNQRAIKDVDIFLKSRGSMKKNRKFLKKVFDASGLDVTRQAVYTGGYGRSSDAFPEPEKSTLQEKQRIGYGSFRPASNSEAWTVIAGPQKTEYNVIFIDGPLGEAMEQAQKKNTTPAKPLIGVFDFGLCQIAYDGDVIITSAQYREDVRKKLIKLETANGTSDAHLRRIVKKYDDWELCAESQKIMNPPPKKKSAPAPKRSRSYGGGFYY
jgi:hypothetical protein